MHLDAPIALLRAETADSGKALGLIAPVGVICWHDYRFKFRKDDVRALDELDARIPLCQVQCTSPATYRRGESPGERGA